MSRPLDVLVIGGPSGRTAATQALGTAGHRTHDCASAAGGAPCRAVVDIDDCPLDHGTDVALVVHTDEAPSVPAGQSVSCARRAGLPVVELGRDAALDPFAPYLSARLDAAADPVGAAEAAAATAYAELERAVLVMAAPLMRDLGIAADAATCAIERRGDQLRLAIDVPGELDEATRQAIAVRALAALRGVRRHHRSVSIGVNGPRTGLRTPVGAPAG